MPDSRTHRGPHPQDQELFAEKHHAALRAATSELSWLLTRGYKTTSALKLVGDRHALSVRQREAVARSACPDDALDYRAAHLTTADSVSELWIDGFNVLMSVEVALGGGVILHGRDGCYRDVASVHGTYRKVEETPAAVDAVLSELEQTEWKQLRLLLDAPVSNSGRLAELIRERTPPHLPLEVELYPNVDTVLKQCGAPVASADSAVLDAADSWVNLAKVTIRAAVPGAWVVRMV